MNMICFIEQVDELESAQTKIIKYIKQATPLLYAYVPTKLHLNLLN